MVLLLPVWYILALIWNIATSMIYPVFWVLWEILYAPIRLVLGVCSIVIYLCTFVFWLEICGYLRAASLTSPERSSQQLARTRSRYGVRFGLTFSRRFPCSPEHS